MNCEPLFRFKFFVCCDLCLVAEKMWEKSFEYLNSCLVAKEMLQNMGM